MAWLLSLTVNKRLIKISDFQGCASPLVEQLSNIRCCKGGELPLSPVSMV